MARDHRRARGRGPELIAMEAPALVGHAPVKSRSGSARRIWNATSHGVLAWRSIVLVA